MYLRLHRFYRSYLCWNRKQSWRCFFVSLLLQGVLPVAIFAQTKLWDKTIGSDSYDDLYSLQQTLDGGFILGGYSASGKSGNKSESSKGYHDYWVVKLNANGNQQWDKTIGGNFSDDLAMLRQTQDGGYILGGTSFSGKSGDKTQSNQGHNDYWVVKLKADGSKDWDKSFGGNAENYLTAIQQTRDGGFILGGYSSSGKSGDKSQESKGSFDFWVVKIKADGTKEWDKSFGGNNSDLLYALQQTNDGGYILGGTSASGKTGDKTQSNKGDCGNFECITTDYWVVKLNQDGSKAWDKTYGGNAADRLRTLQQTQDGGFILGGHSRSEKSGDKTSAGEGENDYWIIKLNNNGNKVWDKTFGGQNNDYLYSLQQTTSGGYLLGGSSKSEKGGDKSQASIGTSDFWVVKLRADGSKEWDKTMGGNGESYLSALIQANDGGYILGGVSSSGKSQDKTEDSKGGFDFWVVKLTTLVTAQWNMRYGGSGKDNFTTAIRTKDGGYLFGGFTTSGASGDKSQASQGKNDYWIVKSDKNGKKLWEKSFGGQEDDYLNKIIQTADGGYLLAGSTYSGKSGDKSQTSRGDRDYWVVKVDQQGTKEWDKRYGGSGSDELKQVLQLSSGAYVLAGTTNSPATGDISQPSLGKQDYWVIKINSAGTHLWNKRFGGSADETLESIVLTQDGGFLLGGSSDSNNSGDKSENSKGGSDYWLVRISDTGQKVWDKTYGGSGEDKLMALASTGATTGNYILGGTSSSGKSGDKSQPNQGGKDYWILQVFDTGKKMWDNRYGGSGDDELRTIRLTAAGGYLLGGSSTSGANGNKSQDSQGASDYWLLQTNNKGEKEWDQRFGGSAKEELRAVVPTTDGGYLLGGRSDSGESGDRTQPSQGGTDYWLVKIAPVSSSIVASREISSVEEVGEAPPMQLNAYPNPFGDQLAISFTLPETQPATVLIYDSQGRAIATLFQGEAKAHQTYELNWQASKKAAGLYFLQLQSATKKQQLKLLLAK
ncbi:T9SS type A sorting domain-containing protein [Adhaeribacter swui]|uniref:T9SS type A sorting domain-containing protein n=1 Tax=Adhaeribacter swui TaxID=2086471 RepID=A0A7G7G902_9BACT|nr:T9SS type A sorting domain-containing protein [Adhaeribacter swui]QNF33636.1 T9SS type A sorting domain-containing protein [Adhaeribacter swui]